MNKEGIGKKSVLEKFPNAKAVKVPADALHPRGYRIRVGFVDPSNPFGPEAGFFLGRAGSAKAAWDRAYWQIDWGPSQGETLKTPHWKTA